MGGLTTRQIEIKSFLFVLPLVHYCQCNSVSWLTYGGCTRIGPRLKPTHTHATCHLLASLCASVYRCEEYYCVYKHYGYMSKTTNSSWERRFIYVIALFFLSLLSSLCLFAINLHGGDCNTLYI